MRSWLAAGVAVWLVAGNPADAANRAPAAFAIATGPGPIVRIGCRQGECSWLQRIDTAIVARSGDAVVVRLRMRVATTVHGVDGKPPRKWRRSLTTKWRDQTDYVRCFKASPAVLWPDEDGFYLHRLNLLALAGYQQDSANIYMLVCHGLAPNMWNDRTLARLGYGTSPSGQTVYPTLDAGLAAIR